MGIFGRRDDSRQEIEREMEEEEIEEADSNEKMTALPESQIELNQWQDDPAFRNMFTYINKDAVLSNLTPEDIARVKAKLDIAYQCGEMGMEKAKDFFLSLVAATLNVNCSKDGFVRKQQRTVTQQKSLDITRQKQKKKFGRW